MITGDFLFEPRKGTNYDKLFPYYYKDNINERKTPEKLRPFRSYGFGKRKLY